MTSENTLCSRRWFCEGREVERGLPGENILQPEPTTEADFSVTSRTRTRIDPSYEPRTPC